jgi:hypothetical protein
MSKSSRAQLGAIVLLLALCLVQAAPLYAQLMVVDEEVYVTELRPDKNRIGISSGRTGNTRGWIKIEGGTQVFRRNGRQVSQSQLWRSLRRGMRVKVHGGGDWDTNVVAKKLWY